MAAPEALLLERVGREATESSFPRVMAGSDTMSEPEQGPNPLSNTLCISQKYLGDLAGAAGGCGEEGTRPGGRRSSRLLMMAAGRVGCPS
jgi:hypothetical protein